MRYDEVIIREFVHYVMNEPYMEEFEIKLQVPLQKLREVAIILSKDYGIEIMDREKNIFDKRPIKE